MHTHRLDSFLISDNVRLEIVHEHNPCFAGEPISLAIRIRHLGSESELDRLQNQLHDIDEEVEALSRSSITVSPSAANSPEDTQNTGGWTVKSLFDKLSNKTTDIVSSDRAPNNLHSLAPENMKKIRELRAQRLELENDVAFHENVSLLSGYIQIQGSWQLDTSVIDQFKMNIKSNTLLANGYLGARKISCSMDSHEKESKRLSKYYQSDYTQVTTGLLPLESHDAMTEASFDTAPNVVIASPATYTTTYKERPLLLIPQALLFSEINLHPGDIKILQYLSPKLPKDLPPSYNASQTMAIVYSLEIGLSRLERNNRDKIVPFITRVPLTISPYITDQGYQCVSKLDKSPLIMSNPATKVKDISSTRHDRRKMSVSNFFRKSQSRASFSSSSSHPLYACENADERQHSVVKNFKRLIEGEDKVDTKEFVISQLEMQFGKDTESTIGLPEDFGTTLRLEGSAVMGSYSRRHGSVRNNIKQLAENFHEIRDLAIEPKMIGAQKFFPLIVNAQKSYEIKSNGELLANIHFSKYFYMTSDSVDFVVELGNGPSLKTQVCGISAILEAVELINPQYQMENDDKVVNKTMNMSEDHAICFSDTTSVPFSLILPHTPMNQVCSQFQADIVKVKWMLHLKFVLIDKKEQEGLTQFYEDKKGALKHAKENLDGKMFNCHIQIVMLPSSQEFGG